MGVPQTAVVPYRVCTTVFCWSAPPCSIHWPCSCILPCTNCAVALLCIETQTSRPCKEHSGADPASGNKGTAMIASSKDATVPMATIFRRIKKAKFGALVSFISHAVPFRMVGEIGMGLHHRGVGGALPVPGRKVPPGPTDGGLWPLLVAKGTSLRSPWEPLVPESPRP